MSRNRKKKHQGDDQVGRLSRNETHPDIQPQPANAEDRDTESDPPSIAKTGWWRRPSFTDWALAATTTAYAVVSFFQWQVMQHSAELSQRAWVIPTSIDIARFDAEMFVVSFKIRNSGKTPASDIVMTVTYGPKMVLRHVPGDESAGRGMLGPDSEKEQTGTLRMAAGQYDKVISGELPLFISGAIHYADPFSQNRTTTYCAVYNRAARILEFCPKGNTAP